MTLRITTTLAAAALVLSGCAAAEAGLPPAPGSGATAPGRDDLLTRLGDPLAEDTGAPYKRADWGDWSYNPATKCSRREEIVIRDGHGEITDAQCRSRCAAQATASPPQPPCWISRYDDVGVYDVTGLQADHIVPLAEATRSGARNWTAQQRSAFYNDPANLLMVTAKSNGQKSDNDPARYTPVRHFWCAYATAYAQVKITYGLRVDTAEKSALARMLDTCGGETR
jgi:hypothetical protein